MSAVDCTVHLVTLKQSTTNEVLLRHLNDSTTGAPSYLIKGRAHGWVHQAHRSAHRKQLLAHTWDAFFLTNQRSLPGSVEEIVLAHLSVQVSVPESQYDQLASQVGTTPEPMSTTPALPAEWPKTGGIPASARTTEINGSLTPGELQLDPRMIDFLSNALPADVFNAPVGLFNLFKYPNDDSSVHDQYMEDFKKHFGDAAGASVKFMGPVQSAVDYVDHESREATISAFAKGDNRQWEDANLVQYDSIWHYAYMLSTNIYQELNKDKMKGLEDTCILLVSEVELAR